MTNPDRLTFKYAENLKIEVEKQFQTYEIFSKSFNLSGKKQKKFFNWLEKQELEFKDSELKENWIYIENRILSDIASSIWGKEYLYKKLLDTDKQVQDAILHFDEAHKLID